MAKCFSCEEAIIRQDLPTDMLGCTPNVCISCYIGAVRKLETEGKLRIVPVAEMATTT